MKTFPLVAIIGQTNAGKSSLFNRLVGRREAIVAREEGTTRDNVIATVDDHYILVDTAGLKNPTDEFESSIRDQIEDAITSADLILVLIDGAKYPDDETTGLVRMAQKSKKPYLVVLNKSDLGNSLPPTEFRNFGEKHLLRTSATTGQGIYELRRLIMDRLEDVRVSSVKKSDLPSEGKLSERSEFLPELDAKKTFLHTQANTPSEELVHNESLKIALIGRPNVGKSSLFNTLAKKQQAIVSSRQGTTRDINRVEVKFKGKTLEILDTAGLRKPGKREVGIEKFSVLRTLAAIEESDVCCLLIDSTEPHSKLDQSLAGQIVDAGKGIILVVTKTDLADEDQDRTLNRLENDFNFIPYAPVILTSSETGQNVTKIFELSLQINQERKTTLKTSDLNKILQETTAEHQPAGLKNTKPKLRYITQTDTCPPWFVVYGSDLQQLHWSYKRFLERKIRESYPFTGTPIKFSFRNRD